MKGIIFDFNGTLYWDSQLHYDAWVEYSKILRGTPFTREEMRDKMFGHTNKDIIQYAIGKEPTAEMVEKYAKEKESLYRKRCLIDRENFKLAPGAEEFLDFLKENNIPVFAPLKPLISMLLSSFIDDAVEWAVKYMKSEVL